MFRILAPTSSRTLRIPVDANSASGAIVGQALLAKSESIESGISRRRDDVAVALGAFVRSRACNDEEGRPRVRGLSLVAVLGGPSLLRIDYFEMGGGHVESSSLCGAHLLLFLLLFATPEVGRGNGYFSSSSFSGSEGRGDSVSRAASRRRLAANSASSFLSNCHLVSIAGMSRTNSRICRASA
jgi:hypothetical protein